MIRKPACGFVYTVVSELIVVVAVVELITVIDTGLLTSLKAYNEPKIMVSNTNMTSSRFCFFKEDIF